jgi:hypothetical protein
MGGCSAKVHLNFEEQPMEDAERTEKLAQHTMEVYAAIGKFTVKFEHVCHAMQGAVRTLLNVHGLTHAGLSNAVLSGLTAEPTLRVFQAAVMEVRQTQMVGAELSLFKNVLSRVKALIEVRNDIVHRMWIVGWAGTDKKITPTFGSKHKNSSKGAEFRPQYFTNEDFDRHAEEAEALARIVGCIGASLDLDSPLSAFLTTDKDGAVQAK